MTKQTKTAKKEPQKSKTVKAVAKPAAKKTEAFDENMADAFIMEVDDEVKSDHLKEFFNKYGLYIISAVVLILFATVSFDQIKNWRDNQFREKTNAYIAAMEAVFGQGSCYKLRIRSVGGYELKA